jgi:hypothetical protein
MARVVACSWPNLSTSEPSGRSEKPTPTLGAHREEVGMLAKRQSVAPGGLVDDEKLAAVLRVLLADRLERRLMRRSMMRDIAAWIMASPVSGKRS